MTLYIRNDSLPEMAEIGPAKPWFFMVLWFDHIPTVVSKAGRILPNPWFSVTVAAPVS